MKRVTGIGGIFLKHIIRILFVPGIVSILVLKLKHGAGLPSNGEPIKILMETVPPYGISSILIRSISIPANRHL